MAAELAFDVPFEEAIAFARSRNVALPSDFYDTIQVAARSRAFTVSAIESLAIIQDVLDSLTMVMEQGQSFDQWKQAADSGLDLLTDARKETVFRTNVQTSYS